jgi:hypothetical protein
MNHLEIQDYWRWQLIRQLSGFINDPSDQNTELLLEMIEDYSKVKQSLLAGGRNARMEPAAADFACIMDA